MTVTRADLFASPDHYLHSFAEDEAVFVPMDRAAYRRSIFLDARISPAADGAMRVPVAWLVEDSGTARPLAWIFHVAHCGSTLLARALEELGTELVLREPLALRGAAAKGDPERLALALRMCSKRYPGDGPTLVKANVPVNFVLPDIAAADPDARAIFLHFGWRDYLLAILRSPNHRAWLRSVTDELAGHLGAPSALNDAERAAALWLAQTRRFAAALDLFGHARVLDAEHFFAESTASLAACAAHFGIEVAPGAIAALTSGPLFASYSKNPAAAFDNAARETRRIATEADIAEELATAERWLETNVPDLAALEAKLAGAALS